jgi:hypothetical protein
VNGINLKLIEAYTTADGKAYYYLDHSQNGSAGVGDLVTHNALDQLLNDHVNTVDTQQAGAVDGISDARTLMIDGYTLVLPTRTELVLLASEVYQDQGNISNQNWLADKYWSATPSSSGYHQYVTLSDTETTNGNYSHSLDTGSHRVVFQVLYGIKDTALARIEAAANANNTSSQLVVTDYQEYGVTGITDDNLGAINNVLDQTAITANQVNTLANMQAIVDGYVSILDHADGVASDDVAPTYADYTALGLSLDDDPEVIKLLGQVIDTKNNGEVDTVAQLQAIADAVQSVMQAAAGASGQPSLAELHLLGIDSATADNLLTIQSGIVATANDGTEVDSVHELHVLASGLPSSIELTDIAGINLSLISPHMTADGKIYYYLDQSGNGSNNDTDTITHGALDGLLNSGSNTFNTQVLGAIEGVDDARTVIIDGYTLVLPNVEELQFLQNETGLASEYGYQPARYWSANAAHEQNHYYVILSDTTAAGGSSYITDHYRLNVVFQVLFDQRETALNKISVAADNNSASANLTLEDYQAYGVTGITKDNLAVINNTLDQPAISATQVNILANMQAIANAYINVLDHADGVASDDTAPTYAQYSALGLILADDAEAVKLLGQVIDSKTNTEVDTVAQLQAITDAVQSVMQAAAGVSGQPSLAELHLLGIDNATADNLSTIQSAIVASANDGSKVDSVHELRLMAAELPSSIELTDTAGINLSLINPHMTVDGKIYYYLDQSGNGSNSENDTITHSALDALLNNYANTSNTQQNTGAIEGVDDERTVIIDGYTLVLPNVEELQALQGETGLVSEYGYKAQSYWSANAAHSDNHYYVGLTDTGNGYSSYSSDGTAYGVIFQVLFNQYETALNKIAAAADANDADTSIALSDYTYMNLDGVDAGNYQAFNSVLNAAAVTSTDVDSLTKMQTIVDSYSKVMDIADSLAFAGTLPTQTDYNQIGIAGIDSAVELQLLNQIVDLKSFSDIDTIVDLQALADAVQSVIAGAAGAANLPTQIELNLLGFDAVTGANISAIQAAIAATADDGSGVGTYGELALLVASTPTQLDLSDTAGVNLKLIAPVTLQSGKTYYFLDVSNDGSSSSADTLTHTLLGNLFNAGSATVDSQENGAVAGIDDARTVLVDGYTLILPTSAELSQLYADISANPPQGWDNSAHYWSATYTSAGYHYSVKLDTNGVYNSTDGTSYLVALQVIDSDTSTALADIASAAQANTAVANLLSLETFKAAGIVGVTEDNIGLIRSALDSSPVVSTSVDSVTEIQDLVDAAVLLLANADGVSSDTDGLSYADYVDLGVATVANMSTNKLLGQAIDVKSAAEVDSVAALDALAEAAYHVTNAPSLGDASAITLADLHLLGVDNVTTENLSSIQATIVASATDGSGVDTLSELRLMAADVPAVLDLTDVGGLNLRLIQPVISQDGKLYYVVDINGDNSHAVTTDAISHNTLDAAFNGGSDTYATQSTGTVEGMDDARTLISDGYTIVLPTMEELITLRDDALADAGSAPNSWYSGSNYWAADEGNRYGYHDMVRLDSNTQSYGSDTSGYYLVVEVLSSNRDAALATITAAAEANDAAIKVTLNTFDALHIANVTSSNLGSIQNALDSSNVNASATDTCAKVQALVDSYNTVLEHATGVTGDASGPLYSDYVNIGVSLNDDAEVVKLLNQALQLKSDSQVDTVANIQALADAASNVMAAAASNGSQVSLADLELLGVAGVTAANLSAVQTAIADSNNTGVDVDTLGELRLLAADVPAVLDLSDVNGLNLKLINPAISQDGKLYYVLDIDNNGSHTVDDRVVHNTLDAAFNSEGGNQDTYSTQLYGAVEGVDDVRTLISDGYTVVLPTRAELLALVDDALSDEKSAPNGWFSYEWNSQYWAADQHTQSDMHAVAVFNGNNSLAGVDATYYHVAVEVLFSNRDAALATITAAAETNDAATKVTLSSFDALNITKVTSSNLDGILNALDTSSVDGSATDTFAKIQAVVDSYNVVLAHATGVTGDATGPTYSDYVNVGVSFSDDTELLKLLNQALQMKSDSQVDTVTEIQALADAASNVMTAAASNGSQVSLTDLKLLGVAGVTAANLSAVQTAIADSNNTGVDVDTLGELRLLAADVPAVLDLSDVNGLNLKLINPVISQDGKLYYVLDIDNNGSHTVDDGVVHNTLDAAFNSEGGNQDTYSTQPYGAVEGVDDVRTLISDGYTIVLPTKAELVALANDALSVDGSAPNGWHNTQHNSIYWAANQHYSAGSHDIVYFNNSSAQSYGTDASAYYVAVEVLFSNRDAALATITAAAEANDAATKVTLSSFDALNISKVTSSNLDGILNALDTSSVDGSATDTFTKIQAIVDAYVAVFAHADGESSRYDGPTLDQYALLGVTGVNDTEQLKLLNQVIDVQSSSDVDTVAKLQAYVDAVTALMSAAAGDGSEVSLAQLELLDIGNIDAGNLSSVQAVIAATNDDGTGVDTYGELRLIATAPTATLDLRDASGINLNLIKPIVTQDGKLYYYLDLSNDGSSAGTDTINHNLLDAWLNGGADTVATQSTGAVAGVDDERTVIVDGYTLVLPTLTEVQQLNTDAVMVADYKWDANIHYWTSTLGNSADQHWYGYTDPSTTIYSLPDANLAKVFLQVLNNDVETGTENVDTLTGTSNSEVINALAGDDVIVANGGSDMIDGGAGDDSIHINADNIAHLDDVVLDGGTGTDTLYLVGSSLTLDFTSLASQHVQNIEVIEITGSGDNILEIDASDVLELSSTTDVLKVLGDSGDSVDVATTMLTTGVTHTEDGVTYHVYADTSVAAELWLDVDLSVI